MLLIITTFVVTLTYIVFSIIEARRHEKAVKKQFKHRIHVNGIRGKSSVTRLVAGAMREAGIKTVAKTTGTNARIMVSNSIDWPIERKEANISEQRKLIKKYLGTSYKAMVFECMAINPIYQKYLEEKIMHSTIGIITNVREDHMDKLGNTLEEIAKNLALTIPYNGHFITSEKNKKIREIFETICNERGTKMHSVGFKKIDDKIIQGFEHFEHKENVAMTLCLAEILGIDKRVAIKGMQTALPDPGAFKVQPFEVDKNQTIYWANLFAINDRESFVKTLKTIDFSIEDTNKKAVILNNRKDRPERVSQFVDIALNNFKFDYVFTFGDYEKQVIKEVGRHKSRNKPQVICLGNSTEYSDANGELLWQKIIDNIPSENCLLVGAVNIHTPQSQNLLSILKTEEWPNAV